MKQSQSNRFRVVDLLPTWWCGLNKVPAVLFVLAFLLIGHTRSEERVRSKLRILTYNIHHGEGIDGKLDLQRIAAVIRSAKPDLVMLQEVDCKVPRSGSKDQARRLAELTGMNFAFGPNIDLQGGQYGNALLSRYRIRSQENHSLPNVDEGEQRGVLTAIIDAPQIPGGVAAIATHFDHRRPDKERLESAEAINRLSKKCPATFQVLAGDLNDVRGSRCLKTLESHWTMANSGIRPTVPVANPTRQIDYVLYRSAADGQICTVVEARVLDNAIASDHRALLAVIEITSPPPSQ